jgi:branched-chain amino acid transport system permease protein
MKPLNVIAAALGAVLVASPFFVDNALYQHVAALAALAALSASAWNVLGGYAGQISFGHSVYFGVGAYASLLAYQQFGLPPIAGAPAGILASLVLSVVVGMPTFRLSGHYFSMATFAFAELLLLLFANWAFAGAAVGLMGPASARSLADLLFRSSLPYYGIFLAALVLLLWLTWLMQRSRMGFYLRALRSGERAAASLGVPIRRYKLYALFLSGSFAALAGSLFAVMVGFIDPDSAFSVTISVNMVIMAALGGAGTLLGPTIGAAILVPLQEATNDYLGGGTTGAAFVVYGVIIMLIARFAPGGLAEIWSAVTTRRGRRAA